MAWVELANGHLDHMGAGHRKKLLVFPSHAFLDQLIKIARSWKTLHPRKRQSVAWAWHSVTAMARTRGRKRLISVTCAIADLVNAMIDHLKEKYGQRTPLDADMSKITYELGMNASRPSQSKGDIFEVRAILADFFNKKKYPKAEVIKLLEPYVEKRFRAPKWDILFPRGMRSDDATRQIQDFTARAYAAFLLAEHFAGATGKRETIRPRVILGLWLENLGNIELAKKLDEVFPESGASKCLERHAKRLRNTMDAGRQARRRSKRATPASA